eukprot:CAMPEP_0170742838 /NCGR_PEP_ID=MMETSP0437-20130122/6952_1 /TAXON_ID=0 /ORGANISM="Sexangularia sp." /LENGTH=274 /DNA_ID=CAMNT_0011081475 /DNA_START=164 /DNA_END=985 /DNA_ORIENTATION=-
MLVVGIPASIWSRFYYSVAGSPCEQTFRRIVSGTSTTTSATSSGVWQVRYGGPRGEETDCRATLVVSADGCRSILISPPQWTQQRSDSIAAIAPLCAIVMPSTSHDVNARAWADKYPSIPVITQDELVHYAATDRHISSEVLAFSSAAAKELLSSVGIVDVVPLGCTTLREDYFVISLGEERTAVLTSCGFMNSANSLGNTVMGFGGLRLTRFFALLLVNDIDGAARVWHDIASVPHLHAVLFMHGEPLVGSPAAVQRAVAKARVADGRHFLIW